MIRLALSSCTAPPAALARLAASLTLVVLCGVIWGCAEPPVFAIVRHDPYDFEAPRRVPNLALGESARQLAIADEFTYRSTWPSTRFGYRFNDESHTTQIRYDDQSFYDRFGGGYTQITESVRSGVLLR